MRARFLWKYFRGSVGKLGVQFIECLSLMLVWWTNLKGTYPVWEVSHHGHIQFLLARSIIFLDVPAGALRCFCTVVGCRIMSLTLIRSQQCTFGPNTPWPQFSLASFKKQDNHSILLGLGGKKSSVCGHSTHWLICEVWAGLSAHRTAWTKGQDRSLLGGSDKGVGH